MKPKLFRSTFLASTITLAIASSAHAQSTYYWDGNNGTVGFGTASGTWDSPTTGAATAGWTTSINGTTAINGNSVTTASSDLLNFGTAGAGLAAGPIAVSGTVDANRLTFGSKSGAIVLSGGTINMGGTTPTINTLNTSANTISSILDGTSGLTKVGIGTLNLTGSAVNTLTGGINVNGGTLGLNFANLVTPTDLIGSGNTLSLGGGTLLITGKSTGTTNQTLGNVTLNSGGGKILGNKNGGTALNITLGTLTTTAKGGGLLFGAGGTAANIPVITTTTNKDATGIYGGRAVYFDGTASTGYNWLSTSSAGPTYTLGAYSGYSALALGAGTDTLNSRITASATLTGSRTTNSLKFENPLTAQTLDLGTNTLTLDSGGLLITGAAVTQGPRISNGTLTAGAGSNYDLIVHQYNASSGNGSGTGNNTTISAVIANNGANPVSLVKEGTGALLISGANTFTGGIVLNGGLFGLTSGTALNNNAMTFNASTVVYYSTTTSTGAITINNGSVVDFRGNTQTFTTSGAVTGVNGGITLGQNGGGATNLNFNSTANTFTGPIEYRVTPNAQNGSLTVNSLADSASLGAGNISFGLAGGSTNSHIFTYGSGAIAPLTLNNRRFELAGSTASIPTIQNNSSQAFTINTDLLSSGTGTKTLTIGGTGAGISTFAGDIANGTITTLNVTKTGASTSNTWVLSGDNSFNGLLTLTGSTAASTSSVLTLSGDNIGMTGGVTINGNATAGAAGARLNINSPTAIGTGTLSFGANPSTIANTSGAAITLTTNNAMAWNQDFTFATGSDLNMGTGAVTLGGNRAITTGSTLTVGGVISDGVNDFGITKGGGGGLTLSGLNSYSGKTSVNQGVISINTIGNVSGGDSSLGNPTTVANGTINVGSSTLGGTLLFTGAGTSTDRVINLSGTTGGAGLNMSGTGTLTFTSGFTATGAGVKTLTLTGSSVGVGVIEGAIVNSTSNTALAKTGSGTWTLSGPNTYSGGTTMGSGASSDVGTLNITHSSALGTGAFSIVSNLGNSNFATLTLNSATGITVANNMNTSGEGAGNNGIIRNVTGNNEIGGTITLTSGGGSTRIGSDGGSLTLSGNIAPNATGRSLILDGSANGTISGSINDGAGANVLVGVKMEGTGTWTFSGTNNHTGTTTVSSGTLLINGNSSTAIGAVAVNAGTLGGNGTIGGAVTVGAATLAPGTSPGTLTIANALVLNSTSILAWELNAADQTVGSNINDLVTGVTDLTLDGTINVTSATLLAGTWRLFNYTGTLFNNTLNLGTIDVGSGLTASIDTTTPFQVNLVVIPEPNVAALIGALGGILLLRRRR